MPETPPPRDPREPDEETVVVPPAEPPVDETVVVDAWEPESEVFVEQTEREVVPSRRIPVIWPWLLALLLLVLGGLGAYYVVSRDDDDDAAATTATTPTTAATTTAATTTQATAPVSVPDVVGTTSSEATAALRDAGLEANLVSVPSDSPAGTVVAQSPAAGTDAPGGSAVRLNVARRPVEASPLPGTTAPATTTAPTETTPPPGPATVPDVVGQELADAARAFADQGLKLSVKYVPSTEAQGRVVAQAQSEGTELRRGDTVQVNVSVGAEPAEAATVPNVAGQRQDSGRRALEDAGFEVLALSLQSGQVRNESVVGSQSPAAGASIPRGSLVVLYVT